MFIFFIFIYNLQSLIPLRYFIRLHSCSNLCRILFIDLGKKEKKSQLKKDTQRRCSGKPWRKFFHDENGLISHFAAQRGGERSNRDAGTGRFVWRLSAGQKLRGWHYPCKGVEKSLWNRGSPFSPPRFVPEGESREGCPPLPPAFLCFRGRGLLQSIYRDIPYRKDGFVQFDRFRIRIIYLSLGSKRRK